MTVTALPPNGTVLLADGFTPVRLQQALTLAELSALKFKPALSSTAGSRCSGSSTTGQVRSVVDDEAWLSASYSILSVPQHSGARTIGIQICTSADSAASDSYAIITGLPSNGTVLLADGATSVVQGQTLTAAQLRRLRFKPAVAAVGQISNLGFLMVHAAGSAAGCSLLIVHPAAPVTARSAPTPVTAAEDSIAVAAGAAAPFDTYLSSMSASKQIPPVLQDRGGRQEAREACVAVERRHTGTRPSCDGQACRVLNRKPSTFSKCLIKLPLIARS